MGLIDDLRTFLVALALGVVLTVSINYLVVNYTEGTRPAQASAHDDDDDEYYEAPKPMQTPDLSSSNYGTYY